MEADDQTFFIDLFTPETWSEIAQVDYEVSGFRENRWRRAHEVRPGDIFLCYLTGKSRFVGALRVLDGPYWDPDTKIWESDPFPVRFRTELLVRVPTDRGPHLREVTDQSAHARSWGGYYRGSPQRLPDEDGRFILDRLQELAGTVADKEFEIELQVGIEEESSEQEETELSKPERDHERIQYRLLKLGADMGFKLWVAGMTAEPSTEESASGISPSMSCRFGSTTALAERSSSSMCFGSGATGSRRPSRSSPLRRSTPACSAWRTCWRCSPTSTYRCTSWHPASGALPSCGRSADLSF